MTSLKLQSLGKKKYKITIKHPVDRETEDPPRYHNHVSGQRESAPDTVKASLQSRLWMSTM